MARPPTVRAMTVSIVVATLLLAGCISQPGTYPDPNGPRNGAGFLIDPNTGVELPGQPDPNR
jgi:hypothetical protein